MAIDQATLKTANSRAATRQATTPRAVTARYDRRAGRVVVRRAGGELSMSARSILYCSRSEGSGRPDVHRMYDSALPVLGLGFVLGLRHALDVDHLAAVSTILSERRELAAASITGAL